MGMLSRFSISRNRNLLYLASIAAGSASAFSMPVDPPDKTVRVFYIRPTDVAVNPKMAAGIASVMKDAQKYFLDQCQFTFRLNEPIVEVVDGSHARSWYEDNPGGGSDDYWRAVNNGQEDLLKLVPSVKADGNRTRWKIVYYIDAEGKGAGGGGGGGWVLLPKHDADGALGYPKDKARWVGGMSHELGHCFGLPDAAATDGTVMSASFYGWPDCTITPGMTATMKNLGANSGFWSPSITTGIAPRIYTSSRTGSRAPGTTISLYDIAGKRTIRPAAGWGGMALPTPNFP